MRSLIASLLIFVVSSFSWAGENSSTLIVEVLSASSEQGTCTARLRVDTVFSSSISDIKEADILESVEAPAHFCGLAPNSQVGVQIIQENNKLKIE